MKRAFLLVLILSSCLTEDARYKRLRDAYLFLGLMYTDSYDQEECLAYEGPVNPVYFSADYYWTFSSRTGKYKVAVIGDSTMDISSRYSGWLSSGNGSWATAGNTACDMAAQMRSMRGILAPDFVLVATADGNGLAGQRTTLENIVRTNKALHNKIRAWWPGVAVSWVAIHPTKVTYANQNKVTTNAQTKAYVTANGGCWYDPLPLFGVAEGQPAKDSDMIDAIHYNQAMSFQIKSALAANCGLQL